MLRPMRWPLIGTTMVAGAAAAWAASCGGGAPSYDVAVAFNERYTEADLQEVDAILRSYDHDIDVLLQESFPPVARTVIETDAERFCEEIRSQLEGRPYVARVDCDERL